MVKSNFEKFNPDFEIGRISNFLRSHLESAKAKGFVLGISGGIDSAVVASLSQGAVGSEKVLGLLLFEDYHRDSNDYADAKMLVDQLKIKSLDIPISPLITVFEQTLRSKKIEPSRVTLANMKARIRMTLLYVLANQENYLVTGTGDKSEDLIGFFTKWGDGGVDLLPIAHLYKGQVRALGRHLGLPEQVVTKPSSPNLWKGHKATDEIPADYEILDPIMSLLFDQNASRMETSEKTGAPKSLIDEVIRRNLASRHKRSYPAMVASW
ncbi:MAG: NAD+ synthase [Thaumarchaeota archaeon]|nr:NAD+ synthase [Nitrososphaerota archaeon]